MATHGILYLPLDPSEAESRVLSCEAWSDGYLIGMGLGAWCSSTRISEMCKASVLLAGSPFFWDAGTRRLACQNLDYMGDYADNVEIDLKELAPGELDAIEDGEAFAKMLEDLRWTDAAAHGLGRMGLARQMEIGLGMNAQLFDPREAWMEVLAGGIQAEPEEAAERCAEAVRRRKGKLPYAIEHCGNDYIWREGKFWTMARVGAEDSNPVAIPLGMLLAISTDGTGVHGDASAYLQECSATDMADLKRLASALEARGLGFEEMFAGNPGCLAPFRAEREAGEIFAASSAGSGKSALGM